MAERELQLYRFLEALRAQLKPARDVRRALARAVRAASEFLEVESGAAAIVRFGRREASLLVSVPEVAWDLDLLGAFIRRERPAVPAGLLLGPVRRRGRPWAVLAFRAGPGSRPFDRDSARELAAITTAVSEALEHIDRERMLEVRDRIDRKIMEQLRPKDLFYQILHGLRSLTRYDHSAALLIHEDSDEALTLVAEQVAWTKARSERIGLRLPIDPAVRALVGGGDTFAFDLAGGDWVGWDGSRSSPLARLLDWNRDGDGPGTEACLREGAILCAPLASRDGVFGMLKIAACHPGTFGAYDAEAVARFRSQAAIAIQNSRRAESLETAVLQAERKTAMADLARTVSHDVNNALGAVLPLVQQIREDLRTDQHDPAVLREDLEQIQTSLEVCRRIFGGMLQFARGGARRSAQARLRPALDNALAILGESLQRSGIALTLDVPGDLPEVSGSQSDVEQILLNLLTNAREALAGGGTIVVTAVPRDGSIRLLVEDDGPGIAASDMPRIFEPFYTTKPRGSGLGLPICRSIVWEMNGRLEVDSLPGLGTRVQVLLPAAEVRRIAGADPDGRGAEAETRKPVPPSRRRSRRPGGASEPEEAL